MFFVPKICINILFFFVQNVVGDVVHQEGAELPAVRQEGDFNGAGAQEAGLAGEAVVDLEVVAVVVVEVVEVEVDLAAVGDVAGVSEDRSSAASKNLSLYCNSSALYSFFANPTRYGETQKIILQLYK